MPGTPPVLSFSLKLYQTSPSPLKFIPTDLVRKSARACGTISYFHYLDRYIAGEKYLLQPDVEYMYEMEAPEDLIPQPNDGEVEWFQLWNVDQIKQGLADGLFKPSYALVPLDFFVRHGVLDTTNEPDYMEICSRLHRILEFPTRRDA